MHNFSVWREPQAGQDLPGLGPLWAKCKCRWSGYAKTYDDLAVLCEEHRDDAERAEELEREEQQHA